MDRSFGAVCQERLNESTGRDAKRGLTCLGITCHVACMQLSNYLSDQKISDLAFAGLVGRDRSIVAKWRKGRIRPDWEAIKKIVEVTNGVVTADDFIQLPRAEAAE